MLSGDMSLSRLWLMRTSSMMCNNAYASPVRFFQNRCKYLAWRSSSLNVFSYTTRATMLLSYLLSKLNMSRSIPPFHQNVYSSYFLAWIAANCITPACGIITAIDSFWYSIFVRSFHLSIWFDYFVANFIEANPLYGRISTLPTDVIHYPDFGNGRQGN